MMNDRMETPHAAKAEPAAPRVAAVVLNWNGGPVNAGCLQSLRDCGWPGLEIVFVDNGSTDGSPEEVRARFPEVEILLNRENLGFSAGNNRGIRHALEKGADLVLLLNNDVTVTPGFLQPLVALLGERRGVAGPKILGTDGRIWCAGGRLAFHHNLTELRGFGLTDNGSYEKTEDVDYIPACCLLVSKSVFEEVGLLDEDYFCYLEDVDFCLRSRKAGFPVVYCPSSRVMHHFSFSTGGGYSPARKYMNALNSVRFLKRHGTLKSWAAFWLLDFLALPAVILLRLFQGRGAGALAKARGILEGLAGGRITPEKLERYLRRTAGGKP